VEEYGPCPVFASFALAFTLQLRKKHGKPSVRVRKTSVRLIKTSVSVKTSDPWPVLVGIFVEKMTPGRGFVQVSEYISFFLSIFFYQ